MQMQRIALAIALGALALVAAHDADQFKDFLKLNVLPSKMPRSFAVEPTDYFEKVPEKERPHHYTTPHRIAPCQNKSVPAENMNKYMFQTETLLTALGLNIYDGAVWSMAMSLLNESSAVYTYMNNVLVDHKTVQFPDIRGNAPCKGVMEWGQCSDPNQAGVCGMCYGDGKTNADKTLTIQDAYFFRMISDYWSIEGTVDQRCPTLNMQWTWNDYKPILGENAWAQLLGPAQAAMIKYKFDINSIPNSDPIFVLGIPLLSGLKKMMIGTTGGFYYCPRNTWFGFSATAQNIGSTFSIENQASLLAGLRSLYILIDKKSGSPYKSYLPQIKQYIDGIHALLLEAYSPELGFFRQGGTYNTTTNKIDWAQNGEPIFAVDCQTWVSSVLGTKVIDTKFGNGTAFNIWIKVKAFSNYTCPGGGLCGVGYTFNNISGQVFSGEWTYGAINWLRVMMADSYYNSTMMSTLKDDSMDMYFGLETYLYTYSHINNSTKEYPSVKYANKRYFIPFGWYANPLPATSSTGWAVMVAKRYNPFNIMGGNYTHYDL